MKIVYNSYYGRYSDNPRAIYRCLRARGPAYEHVWLADPRHAETFPAEVPRVRIASPDAVAALESADVVVANTHTDLDTWAKRPETVYLQTWHGTPLKRIHRAAVYQPEEAFMNALDAEITRWDYLVTPSRAGTELLQSTFGYTGEILETGYPRNDVLRDEGAAERRARVRRRLGVPEDQTVVLYAPTYRDDDVSFDVPLGLDVTALTARLGDGHVLWLRRHYFLYHRRPVPDSDRVRDLSAYPEVSDLLLAADVLVTDYSSVLFDFAVTGKPILLFAYDLEHYRDQLRGFTLDLATTIPGPVLRDAGQLAEALLDLPGLRASYAERYAQFRSQYCHLDDGHATERVVARVWPA